MTLPSLRATARLLFLFLLPLLFIGCNVARSGIPEFHALPAQPMGSASDRLPVKVEVSTNFVSVAALAYKSAYTRAVKQCLPRTGVFYYDAAAPSTLEVSVHLRGYLADLALSPVKGPLGDIAAIAGATKEEIVDVRIRLVGPGRTPVEASYPVVLLSKFGRKLPEGMKEFPTSEIPLNVVEDALARFLAANFPPKTADGAPSAPTS